MAKSQKKDPSAGGQKAKVIASARVSGGGAFSRRDFLKLTATTLTTLAAAPLLSSCAPSEAASTPTPAGPPLGSINTDNTQLLANPGDIANVMALLSVGTSVELQIRDSTASWVKIKVRDGEHAGKEGWAKVVNVTFSTSLALDASVPISNDIHPMPTSEIEVKEEAKTKYAQDLHAAPGDTQNSGVINEGDTVQILERDSTDTWFKVRTSSGQEGWVTQSSVDYRPEVKTNVTINYAVAPVVPPAPPNDSSDSSSGGTVLSYWYPN